MATGQPTDGTRVIYYVDEEDTPYLVKLNATADAVTLGDFKLALNKPNCKYFFKSIDDDFGVVKEEITDDSTKLPCFNGRVISWLVSADTNTGGSDCGSGLNAAKLAAMAGAQIGDGTQPPEKNRFGEKLGDGKKPNVEDCDTCTEDTESIQSGGRDHIAPLRNFHDFKHGSRYGGSCHYHNHHYDGSGGGSGVYGTSVSSGRHHHMRGAYGGGGGSSVYEAPSSMLSSDLESTSFFESDGESSRFSGATGTTMSSRYGRHRQRRRRRRLLPISRASSFSSITDSTMSLNIITVTLTMDTVNFLGISIVGQSTKSGDDGIYVGSIMKGGAVAQDGRIEPGDMILEVNGISFEDMSNDDAVRILREQVHNPGPITLVVAKCWDANPRGGFFTIPRQEPVRPIDPRAWILHTNSMTPEATPSEVANGAGIGMGAPSNGGGGGGTGSSSSSGDNSVSTIGNNRHHRHHHHHNHHHRRKEQQGGYSVAAAMMAAGGPLGHQLLRFNSGQPTTLGAGYRPPPQASSGMLHGLFPNQGTQSVVTLSSSLPDTDRFGLPTEPLTVATGPKTVIQAMLHPESGLDIRDRVWLKMTLPNAFIGSDLVDWLFRNVEGFPDRRDCRKYASNLLKFGLIRHTVNKSTFSEQCYYVFGDVGHAFSLEEVDSVSELGTLAAAQQNWSHSTGSTSLTGGLKSTPSQPPPPSQPTLPMSVIPVSNGIAVPFGTLNPSPQSPGQQNGFRYPASHGVTMAKMLQIMSSGSSSSSSSCESATENTLSTTDKVVLDTATSPAAAAATIASGGLVPGCTSTFLPTISSSTAAQKVCQSTAQALTSQQYQPLPPPKSNPPPIRKSANAGSSSSASSSRTDDDDNNNNNNVDKPSGNVGPCGPPGLGHQYPLLKPLPPSRASPATSSLYLSS